MPSKTSLFTPKYCLHKATGQGFVRLNGKMHYLGVYDSPESRQKYHQLVARWEADGRVPLVSTDDFHLVHLIERYIIWAKSYYVKPDGTPSSQITIIRPAMRRLKELHGYERVDTFEPSALKAIRHTFISQDLSRKTVNEYVKTIKHCFKWGVGEGLVPPHVYGALQAVAGLAKGRSAARDTEPISPVDMVDVEKVLLLVSPQVAALIRLQLLTGARPGELLGLRPIDIGTSEEIWVFNLNQHKTTHHGKSRFIYFNKEAQKILKPFMSDRPLQTPLFSPVEAEEVRYSKFITHRRTYQKTNPKRTSRKLGDLYTVGSYRQAIQRACDHANITRWSPNQLRHTVATQVRKKHGLEAAQVILGHSKADVTQVYAERDESLAKRVIRDMG